MPIRTLLSIMFKQLKDCIFPRNHQSKLEDEDFRESIVSDKPAANKIKDKCISSVRSVESSVSTRSNASSSSNRLDCNKETALEEVESVDDEDDIPKFTHIMVAAIAAASVNYAMHGYNNLVTNGILASGAFLKQFPSIDTLHTTPETAFTHSRMQGLTVGVYQLGCALGAILCCFLSDHFGRKPLIHVIGFLNIVGVVLQTSAFNIGHLMAGRIITGIGVGAGHATFPLYLAECIPSELRGKSVLCCASASSAGNFIGAVMGVAFYFVHTTAQWRTPLGLELILSVLTFVLPFWCPESPRLLIRKRKFDAACYNYAKISGEKADSNHVRQEMKKLELAMEAAGDQSQEHPPRLKYRFLLAIFIQCMATLSGIDTITFFSTQTFERQLHFSQLSSRFFTMGLQGFQWIFSTLVIFLIDSFGRRKLVMGCSISMACAMASLCGLTWQGATESMFKGAILFYFIIMCVYPLGYNLVPSLIAAELSPATYRHKITAVAMSLHFCFGFMITMITPIAFESIHSRYYFVFLATNMSAFIIVMLLFPETKGFALEDIEQMFLNKKYLAIGPDPLKPRHISIEKEIIQKRNDILLQSIQSLSSARSNVENSTDMNNEQQQSTTLPGLRCTRATTDALDSILLPTDKNINQSVEIEDIGVQPSLVSSPNATSTQSNDENHEEAYNGISSELTPSIIQNVIGKTANVLFDEEEIKRAAAIEAKRRIKSARRRSALSGDWGNIGSL